MFKQKILSMWPFHRKTWTERHFYFVLTVAVLGAVAIALIIGASQSVWFDEAYSIMVAKQPIGELLALTGVDTHPPLYYILLKGWAYVAGWSEIALRSFSVAAMGGSLVIGALFVKKFFGVRAALLTLPFLVLAPFLLRYGFEIRMYALGSLIGIAATYVLALALNAAGKKRMWLFVAYAILVALGMYSLYYMAILWVAHVVWLMWYAKMHKKPLFRSDWLLAYIGSIVLFLPWLPTFVSQLGNGALAPISQAMTLDNLMGIISYWFVYQPTWQLNALISLLVLFVIVTVSYLVVAAFKQTKKEQRSYFVLLICYVLVPITMITLVSLVRPMYVERYLAHIAIGGMILIGVSAAIVTKNASRLVNTAVVLLPAVLLVGVMNLAQVGNYNFQRLQKPMVNQIAMALESCKQGDTILAEDPYVAIELDYYLPNCQIHFYSEYDTLNGGYAPLSGSELQIKNVEKELVTNRPVLYVYYDTPDVTLPSNLIMTDRAEYGPVTIARFNAE